jgi:hypothetical protein
MPITVVQDTITWALYEAEFRQYLDLESTDARLDALLEDVFGSAAQEADDWIDNPFDGSEEAHGYTLTGLTLNSVKLGMFAWGFRILYGQGPDGPKPGLTQRKTDFLSEGFAGSKVTRPEDMEAALGAAKPHWAKFQRRYGFV